MGWLKSDENWPKVNNWNIHLILFYKLHFHVQQIFVWISGKRNCFWKFRFHANRYTYILCNYICELFYMFTSFTHHAFFKNRSQVSRLEDLIWTFFMWQQPLLHVTVCRHHRLANCSKLLDWASKVFQVSMFEYKSNSMCMNSHLISSTFEKIISPLKYMY